MPVVINGTSGITGPDGSSSAPALKGTDSDTGFVFGAGVITASINGTSANVPLVSETAKASTSGTSIEFLSIPSWVKRIIVMFNQVSTSGANNFLVQIGAGSYTITGYASTSMSVASGATAGNSRTEGFHISSANAGNLLSGHMTLTTLGSNIWVASHNAKILTTNTQMGAGDVTLTGTLDRLRVISSATGAPADTFDNGTINIMYE